MFGRKPSSEPVPPAPQPEPEQPGHIAVLTQLRDLDTSDPLARPRLAGRIVYDLVCRIAADERGVRVEDVLAILAATGGFSCIVSVMQFLRKNDQTPKQAGLMVVQGDDHQLYYFGDLPNHVLLESEHALLSLALGAAQACGGEVSLDMVHAVMRRVAGGVGGPDFGIPELPAANRPRDLPIHYVQHLWPKILDALDRYEVPVTQRPAALGFALQQAIAAGQQVLDPTLAAEIIVECAVPMAKIDPARFGW